ncbi:futalosine hydrolase [Streptomyces sp. ADI98-10]|uniref:futalosine hydrolase n=1 Tax=Streptomyces sp. ADI98-10 TaxID=1522763 RepID=UPI000F557873|nr:futalosine hydrolase [Streptomyces sp. ADI98-10]RPK93641.1 Futalosine hydrolase [Streptomyces sp. ADI98-10]
MRVLVVTAVPVERDAVTRAFGGAPESVALPGAEVHRCGAFDVLAGGAGPAAAAAATAFALASASRPPGAPASGPYGLVVSAGIGGAFTPLTPLGSLVVASGIVAADLGAETRDGFLPVTALGFGRDRFTPPPALVRDVAAAAGAAAGPVLTVSTVTGTAERAAGLLAAHPGALAEAMEGFGVAEAADRAGVPVLELRAVSNAVGPRDRDAWRIGDALAALTDAFGKTAPVLEGWNRHDH